MADAPVADPRPTPRRKVNTVVPALGIAVGVVPFFTSGRETFESSVQGTGEGTVIQHVTHRARFDRIGVPCGAVAAALGFITVFRAGMARKYGVLALGLAAMALGVFQMVRGFRP